MAKIAIIEDEAAIRRMYALKLKFSEFEVCEAEDGEHGLVIIEEHKPDLVLLDLRMPKMDGVELLKNLDLAKNYPKTKVIVFSNYDVQEDIDKAFELGATRYMLKAWASPKELVRVVKDTLKNKG